MATINGVEVIGDKAAHDFDLLDKNDGINLANGVERNRKAAEDNHEDIVLHRTDRDVHVTPEWKNSLVTKEILGLYWTAAQTADIINEISIAGGAKLVKVDELPETGKEQTIYLVPKQDPQQGDIFDEYVWINGKYEFVGTTKVDLANYVTKAELNAGVNTNAINEKNPGTLSLPNKNSVIVLDLTGLVLDGATDNKINAAHDGWYVFNFTLDKELSTTRTLICNDSLGSMGYYTFDTSFLNAGQTYSVFFPVTKNDTIRIRLQPNTTIAGRCYLCQGNV